MVVVSMQGGVLGRNSLGIEINPVGWLYGTVKLNPASREDVIDRLLEIYGKRNDYTESIQRMPEFIISVIVMKF